MIDFLIVGAGITGATIARLLTDAGASCLVIDKRSHIGGNCYDEAHEDYYINRYGGHIFHTNNKPVWDFVNRFSDWLPYEHRVKAYYREKVYSLPPNRLTLEQMGTGDDEKITLALVRRMFFAGYSYKQWGLNLDCLPNGVMARIPIRNNYDDRYFSDRYQAMPANGYTQLIEAMLKGVPVALDVTFPDHGLEYKQVIYTGSLDALYDYEYGRLPYRSLRWETEHVSRGIGCATLNFTDFKPDYTRKMEWQYFGHRQKKRAQTAVTTEWPEAYNGTNEPMYPINTPENNEMHKKYVNRANREGLLFAGRLATYRYLDMHQAIGNGMVLVKKVLS